MDIKENKVESQIETWAIIGPVVTLMTLLVSMMRPTEVGPIYSLTLLVGILICWKWKLKGVFFSAPFVLLLVGYNIIDVGLTEILWNVGLGVCAILSFLVTALSFDEVEALTRALQVESKSRLENLLKLDEKFKQESKNRSKSEEELQATLLQLKGELESYKEGREENERLAQLVRSELATAKSRSDELLQELFEANNLLEKREGEINSLKEELSTRKEMVDRQELDLAYEEIAALEQQASRQAEELAKIEGELKRSGEELSRAVEEREEIERQREAFHAEIARNESEIAELKKELQSALQDEGKVLGLEGEVYLLKEQCSELELTIKEREEELSIQRQKFEEVLSTSGEKEILLQQMIHEAAKEKESLEIEFEKLSKKESSELRVVKGQLTQLQKQFEEKSEVLDETRRALFRMQENLLLAQRELEEARKSDRCDSQQLLEETIAKMEMERKELEKTHQQEVDDLHEIIASLSSS